jgi:hypothetical protein
MDAPTAEIDVSLIDWMLSRTPEERLAVLQNFVDGVLAIQKLNGLPQDPRIAGTA